MISMKKTMTKGKKKIIGEPTIPMTIFSKKLEYLESIVKYLKENLKLSYSEISEILNRGKRTIQTIYNRSTEKQPKQIEIKKTLISVPVSIFKNRKLTIAESIIIYLKKKGLKYIDIAKLINRDYKIPITIFNKELGCLESVVKYLKENLGLNYHEIALILNRNERTIWTAYHKAIKKQPKLIEIKKTSVLIPISVLMNRKLTVLEAIIIHLKKKELKYTDIAKLISRDQRNVWVVYSRAIKKKKTKK